MITAKLAALERAGNRLPHPVLLFVYFTAAIWLLTAVASLLGFSAVHPVSQQTLAVKSLLSADGLRWQLSHAVQNFVGFAPVGTVLVAMLGIGIAEHSGLMAAALRRIVANSRGHWLTAAVVFAGIMSSLGADAGYVVLVPLAGSLFYAAGRPPLAGIAAAFAGVSGGFSASLLIGPFDAVLAGLSTEALQSVAPADQVSVAANAWFLAASALLLTIIGTAVTARLVEPMLLAKSQVSSTAQKTESLTTTGPETDEQENNDSRGLRAVAIFTLIYGVLFTATLIGEPGLFDHQSKPGIANSLALRHIVTLIALYAGIAGIVFGRFSGRYQSSSDWITGAESSMAAMASYLVLMFFAAQFVNAFAWSQLGPVLAIKGAALITSAEIPASLLLVLLILLTALINLLVGSGSAKWAMLAPIFIPMFFLAGIDPAATQLAFRIGDSSTNIITPLMPYFAVVLAFGQRYQSDLGIGTLLAIMLPYSLVLLLLWPLFLVFWTSLGLPLGF